MLSATFFQVTILTQLPKMCYDIQFVYFYILFCDTVINQVTFESASETIVVSLIFVPSESKNRRLSLSSSYFANKVVQLLLNPSEGTCP